MYHAQSMATNPRGECDDVFNGFVHKNPLLFPQALWAAARGKTSGRLLPQFPSASFFPVGRSAFFRLYLFRLWVSHWKIYALSFNHQWAAAHLGMDGENILAEKTDKEKLDTTKKKQRDG